jgi:hypothetical protein
MDKKLLLDRIEASRHEVAEAEERLMRVLRETPGGPRAEKTTVTEIVSEAISKLRAARADLVALGKLVSEDKD